MIGHTSPRSYFLGIPNQVQSQLNLYNKENKQSEPVLMEVTLLFNLNILWFLQNYNNMPKEQTE